MKRWADMTREERRARRKENVLLGRLITAVAALLFIPYVFFIDLWESGLRGALTNGWANVWEATLFVFARRGPMYEDWMRDLS